MRFCSETCRGVGIEGQIADAQEQNSPSLLDHTHRCQQRNSNERRSVWDWATRRSLTERLTIARLLDAFSQTRQKHDLACKSESPHHILNYFRSPCCTVASYSVTNYRPLRRLQKVGYMTFTRLKKIHVKRSAVRPSSFHPHTPFATTASKRPFGPTLGYFTCAPWLP